FFQYHIGWIIFSLLPIFLRNELSNNIDFNWFLEVDVEKISYILSIIAILIFVLGVSRVTAQEFKVKSVDEVIKKYFSPNPIYRRPHNDFSSCYFEMISDMEDKTYFKRKQTYSFLSFEFISIKNKQLSGNTKSLMEYAKKAYKFIKRSKNIRGYSTLEMQLIRILFIEAGYNKKIVRKIFELVYTKIFLQSLKNFYEANVYEHRSEYKKYLLFIYFNNTNTKIAGKSFQSMRNVFPEKEIKDWSNEELFVVCAGLPYRDFTAAEVLSAYQYIIEKYELDRVKIKESIKAIESKNILG
ncbi:TPA: transglycosylase domain-containing protein, partial [Listeria innocua]|nr:transglycosylase domain-containing protein [Listeria innocua]